MNFNILAVNRFQNHGVVFANANEMIWVNKWFVLHFNLDCISMS